MRAKLMSCTYDCVTFGQVNSSNETSCFACKDFSPSRYAHRILEAVDAGNFEADEDLMSDFNKYVNSKYVPTVKRQTKTLSDKIALWTVGYAGTMAFTYLCVALIFLPSVFPKTVDAVSYIASALQLLFLPLILVASNLQQRRAELREESAYKIQIKQDIQIEWINYKLDRLKKQISEIK
jgi:hypothetical protein